HEVAENDKLGIHLCVRLQRRMPVSLSPLKLYQRRLRPHYRLINGGDKFVARHVERACDPAFDPNPSAHNSSSAPRTSHLTPTQGCPGLQDKTTTFSAAQSNICTNCPLMNLGR